MNRRDFLGGVKDTCIGLTALAASPDHGYISIPQQETPPTAETDRLDPFEIHKRYVDETIHRGQESLLYRTYFDINSISGMRGLEDSDAFHVKYTGLVQKMVTDGFAQNIAHEAVQLDLIYSTNKNLLRAGNKPIVPFEEFQARYFDNVGFVLDGVNPYHEDANTVPDPSMTRTQAASIVREKYMYSQMGGIIHARQRRYLSPEAFLREYDRHLREIDTTDVNPYDIPWTFELASLDDMPDNRIRPAPQRRPKEPPIVIPEFKLPPLDAHDFLDLQLPDDAFELLGSA